MLWFHSTNIHKSIIITLIGSSLLIRKKSKLLQNVLLLFSQFFVVWTFWIEPRASVSSSDIFSPFLSLFSSYFLGTWEPPSLSALWPCVPILLLPCFCSNLIPFNTSDPHIIITCLAQLWSPQWCPRQGSVSGGVPQDLDWKKDCTNSGNGLRTLNLLR